MRGNHEEERIQTTLGDLVVAVSDAAFELCEDKKGAYLLAGLVLEEILKKAPLRTSNITGLSEECYPEETVFH